MQKAAFGPPFCVPGPPVRLPEPSGPGGRRGAARRTIDPMRSGWQRVVAVVGLALSALLLAGCDVSGTIDLQADDALAVDVVVSGDGFGEGCPDAIDSLAVTTEPGTDGATTCRITGTLPIAQLSQVMTVKDVGEYTVITVTLQPDDLAFPDPVDLTLRFPGEVLASSGGQVDGNRVRISRTADLRGLEIVALNRPGPPDRVIWGLVGVGVGALGVGAFWVARRRTRLAADSAAAHPDLSAADVDPPQAAAPPAAALAPELFVPGSPAPVPPADPSPDAADTTQTDHSIWAPPANGE